jgi:hypothetical protein
VSSDPIEADVIELHPKQERTCYDCVHYAMTGASVSWCVLFNESILSERLAAQDCGEYEPGGAYGA